jgi:acyl carrier protein
MNINDFIILLEEAFEKTENSILPKDKFKFYEEWDSIALLTLSAILEDEFSISINKIELDQIDTIEDLYFFTINKSNGNTKI